MSMIFLHGTSPIRVRNTLRNKPCPCGSGIKLKRCCWARELAYRKASLAERGTIYPELKTPEPTETPECPTTN